jgi:prepilin-type processing-associated H-X9-DG protein
MAARGYFARDNALQVGFADGSVELISQWARKFTQSMSLYR